MVFLSKSPYQGGPMRLKFSQNQLQKDFCKRLSSVRVENCSEKPPMGQKFSSPENGYPRH
jgi:hypothetical protein